MLMSAFAAAVTVAGAMGLDELSRLHEHAAGAAAGVEDAALLRSEHLDQHPDDRPRRAELAAPLALGN